MRYILCVVLSFFLLLPQSYLFAQDSNHEEANALLHELVQDQQNIGVAAAISFQGELLWGAAEGLACQEDAYPFELNTKSRIASIAKSMTAVAIMQLVEQNKIRLDDVVSVILDEFPQKEGGQITIKQLLNHTSGIGQYEGIDEVENTVHFSNLSAAMEVFKDRPLRSEPGTQFYYTSYGYVVLGRIIEVVSGLSYEDYMQRNIWNVADMQQTGVENFRQSYPDKSCLYHRKKKKAKSAKQNDLSNRVPGGGLYSTVPDLIKFGNALLDGELIQMNTFDQMIEKGEILGEGNPYGFGFFMYAPKPNESLVVGHSGEQTGCSAQLMLIPKSKTVVVVLSNTSGNWKEVVQFSSQLIRISEQEWH